MNEKPRRTRRPQPIGTFTDCHQLWETALRHGSLVAEFPSEPAAIAMRQRMNSYRALLRDRNGQAFPGAEAVTDYDHFQVALFRDPPRLIIAMRPLTSGIKLTTQEGAPVEAIPYIARPDSQPAAPLNLRRERPLNAEGDDFTPLDL